jgi:hypothetical protein
MHVEPEPIVNPRQQRPHAERRVLRAQCRHKGHHRVVEFVGAAWPAFPRHQADDPPLLEGGLRLIERRARDRKRVGRARHGFALDVHLTEHFVLHLHEIPPIEKVVRGKQWILDGLRTRMERAVGTQGVGFGMPAGWSWRHSKYNYAAHGDEMSSERPVSGLSSPCQACQAHIEGCAALISRAALRRLPSQRRISPNTCGVISLTLPVGACAGGRGVQTRQQIG